jgi:hypothetical protein
LFDLFQHQCIAIIFSDVHNLFFLRVCSWGHVTEVCCRPLI